MTATDLPSDPMDNPPRWVDSEGNVFYRASSLGMCDRVFVALSQAYQPMAHPEWFMEVLQEGKDNEQAIIDHWMTSHEDAGLMGVTNQQADFNLQILPKLFITGHIDGELNTTSSEGIEVKKIRDGQWTKFLRQGVEYLPYYPWQVSAYWFGRNWERCSVIGGRYVDGEIKETYVHDLLTPPIPLIALRKRIIGLEVKINDAQDSGPMDTPCTIKQYPCPFFYLHDTDDAYEPPSRPSDDIVAPLLVELSTLEPRVSEANKVIATDGKRVKEIKSGLHAWLELSGIEDRQSARVKVPVPSDAASDDGAVEGGVEHYEIKHSQVDRDGYTVDPTSYTLVTVSKVGEDGKKITKPRAPRKAAAKKATPKKVPAKATAAKGAASAEPRPVPSLLAESTKPRLAPRPNLANKNLGDATS